MRKVILLALTALIVVGCVKTKENGEPIINYYDQNQHSVNNPFIQVLDSYEYICWHDRMAHKGNCRFCKERRQKELEKLLKENNYVAN